MAYAVRPMAMADIPQVTEIEREAFPTTFPSTSYERELRNSALSAYWVVWTTEAPAPPPHDSSLLSRLGDGLRRWLGEEPPPPTSELLVGYVGVWFLGDEAHITSIAVREPYRRRGLGQLLLATTIDAALQRGCRVITLEARVSNEGAIALYERYGLHRMGIRRGYYTDNREDAVVMSTDPLSSDAFQGHFQGLKASLRERLNGVSAEPRER